MEATIRVDNAMTTLINVFSLEPDKQSALVAALKEGTDTFFSKQPGFISASVVAGRDGRQVINYSQWRSAREIDAFRRNPAFAAYIQKIAALAKAESVMGDVISVRTA
jgi:quinol monooxygenase YgiN